MACINLLRRPKKGKDVVKRPARKKGRQELSKNQPEIRIEASVTVVYQRATTGKTPKSR